MIFKHLSLLIIVIGAMSFFISNVVMKEVLSATHYGQYSIFVTYFSLIYMLGIFGSEQVFLRFSRKTNRNTLETQKSQIILISVIIFFSTIISCILFKRYYPEVAINSLLLFLASFSMIGMLFLFNILRLNTNFVLSQFISNYWKLLLFTLALIFYINKEDNLETFIKIVAVNIVIIFLAVLFYIYKKIEINYNNDISTKDIFITAFHFFLAILSFSLITFADRFIIEMKFSIEEFGNFFYLTNFFLAPYTILQNYVGFKQLIVFKNDFNRDYYTRFNQKAILLGVVMAVFLLIISFYLCHFKLLKFSFNDYMPIILLLLFIGIVRLYSSSIISAFEARTTIETLRKSNIYILVITVFILLIAVFYAHSIQSILMSIIIIWLFRCVVHRQLILHQMKNSI